MESLTSQSQISLCAQALDAMSEAVAILDAQGVVQLSNRAWRNALSGTFDAQPLVSDGSYLDFCRSITVSYCESGAQLADGIQNVLRRNTNDFTAEYLTAGASEDRLFQVRISSFDFNGEAGAIVIHEDVTAVKRIADRLRESEAVNRQRQKMEAIGRLAGSVAHDFNNILMVIRGRVELMLCRVTPDSPLFNDLREIEKMGDRAVALTRQLLVFSRKHPERMEPLQLNHIVAEMEQMLLRLIGEDIELIVDYDRTLGLIEANQGQLEQVLLNLAINARDAIAQNGRVKIETSSVTVTDAQDLLPRLPAGSYVKLSVADNGSGIPPEVLQHIYEPFFTTKPKGKGTGLGLSTVYGIVQQSRGHIYVSTEVGRGTTFSIYFPCIGSVAIAEKTKSAEELQVNRQKTILLVEDEPDIRELVREVLQSCDYRVLEAGDGREAIGRCAEFEGAIDLVMTDLMLPHMNGPELAARIKSFHPQARVLLVSGYCAESIRQQVALPVDAEYLQKPFSTAVLTAKIRDLLG